MAEMASDFVRSRIATSCSALGEHGFRIIAQVPDAARVTDLAFALDAKLAAVIRCVDRAERNDHAAIATMISEGDFIWGAIVYSESAEPDPVGLIESFHVDQLDQLVGRLTELREACSEAG